MSHQILTVFGQKMDRVLGTIQINYFALLPIDLQMDLYSGGLITTIKNLETKIQDLEHFLHSNHGLLLAAKRSLVHCYSQIRKLSK